MNRERAEQLSRDFSLPHREATGSRRKTAVKKNLLAISGPILLGLGLWYGVAWLVAALRGITFPTPGVTFLELIKLLGGKPLADHSIYRHLAESLGRWLVSFGIAALVGVVYGLAAGWSRKLERLTFPLVNTLQLVPGLAWIPVALLIFGVGEGATIFMIAITAFCPVAISMQAGVKRMDATFIRAAQMLGASASGLFLRVLLPGSLPHLLSGLRLGLGNGWRVLVAAEMIVGTGTGLGYCIIQSRWSLDYPSAFACVLVIVLIGLVVEKGVFANLERWTVERWELSREQ
jgi:ABC-type nitrate/sulfonate/bicarbonate transport system permease component